MPRDENITLLNNESAAGLLGISGGTLKRWRTIGRGPKFIQMNRAIRYRVSDIALFISNSER